MAFHALAVKPDVYWVGAIDWSVRNFHGYSTNRGSTYNAYLILDDKITLIDTVKAPFAQELLERVASIVDPARIDVVIANHAEPDHSGAIPAVAKACPHATFYASAPKGVAGLTSRYGQLPCQAVRTGESLSIGRRTLRFFATPMLHWPDNMVTYCPEDRILYSNDGFGQHLATSERFDDETDWAVLLQEAQKYYANILMLYGKQAQRTVEAVSGLDIDLIANGHGVLYRSHVKDILAAYRKWSAGETEHTGAVVYDTMWGSTERLARTIAEAMTAAGIPAKLFDLREVHVSDIMTDLLTCEYLAVGSPTLNNQMMPTVEGFLGYFRGLSPAATRPLPLAPTAGAVRASRWWKRHWRRRAVPSSCPLSGRWTYPPKPSWKKSTRTLRPWAENRQRKRRARSDCFLPVFFLSVTQ